MSFIIKESDGLRPEVEEWLKDYALLLNEKLKIKSKSKARAAAYIIEHAYKIDQDED